MTAPPDDTARSAWAKAHDRERSSLRGCRGDPGPANRPTHRRSRARRGGQAIDPGVGRRRRRGRTPGGVRPDGRRRDRGPRPRRSTRPTPRCRTASRPPNSPSWPHPVANCSACTPTAAAGSSSSAAGSRSSSTGASSEESVSVAPAPPTTPPAPRPVSKRWPLAKPHPEKLLIRPGSASFPVGTLDAMNSFLLVLIVVLVAIIGFAVYARRRRQASAARPHSRTRRPTPGAPSTASAAR